MLVQETVAKYSGKARFVSENFGSSKLAEQFGVTRYPAVFVNDVLVARPRDFGFFAEGENSGRYTPWRNAENQAKFKSDLERMIELVLAGKKEELAREHKPDGAEDEQVAGLPKFALKDLAGKPLNAEQLAGKVVLVEFWATWCPPCGSTLEWLGQLKREHGEKLEIVALAVESPEDQIRKTAGALNPDIRWAISDAATSRAFGDVMAVPTMLIFGRDGKTVKTLYGAPPDLHQQAEGTLEALVK